MTAKTFHMRSSACDTPNLWRKVAERGAAPRAVAARSSARADGKRRVSLRKLVRTRFLPPDEGMQSCPPTVGCIRSYRRSQRGMARISRSATDGGGSKIKRRARTSRKRADTEDTHRVDVARPLVRRAVAS